MKVLAIMPAGDDRERLSKWAEGEPWDVEPCAVLTDALDLLHSGCRFAAIILDKELTEGQWEPFVRNLAASAGGTRIVLASESTANGLWERVVEQGGHDVLSKPLQAEEARRAILHALWYETTIKPVNSIS